MDYKKVGLIATTSVIALGTAVMLPIAAYAQVASSATNEFAQALATKLGISQDKVQTALDQVRTERKAEMQAEARTKIQTALTNGKITQREADILLALVDIRPELSEERQDIRDELKELTEAGRKAQMDTFKAEMDKNILAALNAKNLNVTQTELDALQTKVRAAGLKLMIGPKVRMLKM